MNKNNNKNNLSVIAKLPKYNNADIQKKQKKQILPENRGKSGIYL
jgi:hypothetical protein